MTSSVGVEFPWLRHIETQLQSLDESVVYVGLSGGLDSVCLLHIARRCLPVHRIVAVHVNHGLSPFAEDWQQFSQALSKQLDCHFEAVSVSVATTGQGLEEAARRARYAAFQTYLSEGGVLLLGHHADDQVETVLLHLLRGSGAQGLRGIPSERPLANGKVSRPLMQITRHQLQSYAAFFQLSHVLDDSNNDDGFDRNYLRHHVVPKLYEKFPHIHSAVAATSTAMSEADELQRSLAEQDVDMLSTELDVPSLQALSAVRQRNALRHWFQYHANTPLPRRHLTQLMSTVLAAKSDATPSVEIDAWRITRSRDKLALLPVADMSSEWFAAWDLSQPLQTPFGVLTAIRDEDGIALPERVSVGFRRGGEKIRPVGRGMTKSLKALFKEANMPFWRRQTTPLIFVNDALYCVVGLAVDEASVRDTHFPTWRLDWQPEILSLKRNLS